MAPSGYGERRERGRGGASAGLATVTAQPGVAPLIMEHTINGSALPGPTRPGLAPLFSYFEKGDRGNGYI